MPLQAASICVDQFFPFFISFARGCRFSNEAAVKVKSVINGARTMSQIKPGGQRARHVLFGARDGLFQVVAFGEVGGNGA